MENQFFFFDMDGTLISPVRKRMLKSTVDSLKELQKQGNHVFICSGRAYQMAMEYSDQLDIPGVIFCNGAGIAWKGKVIDEHPMDETVLAQLEHFCRKTVSGYQLLGFEHTYQNLIGRIFMHIAFPRKGKTISEEMKRRRASMVSIAKYNGETVYKMDVFNLNRNLASKFFAQVPEGLQVFTTHGRYMFNAEIMMKGVTKARGVQKVLEMYGGKKENAWCFGDSVNDIEMMKVCGHSIAMGNASKDVKNAADYVTEDANHDGIRNALVHFGILEGK